MKKYDDNQKPGRAPFGRTLGLCGVSVIALTALAAGVASPVLAQDAASTAAPAATSDKGTEVVVVGVRRSLKTAQQIKRDADTVVDSITANDIGAFPDKSVADALQRVAGITVNRFAATGDTAHFSAEPSGVAVRGLPQVRSEFNGRDIFTADSSRGLSWSDVSPELMAGVDTYKNQTADMIEGGIAGSINLRTRLPFDQKGSLYALSIDGSYGDLAKAFEPAVSGLYSNRWDTSIGEFGVMINAAYSKVLTNSQGLQLGRDEGVQNAAVWGTNQTVYIPSSLSLRDNTYDRTRTGVSFASQWQDHAHTMLATFQFNESRKVENWDEYVATADTADNVYAKPVDYVATSSANQEALCATGTKCTFSPNGAFDSGELLGGALGVGSVWYGTVTQSSAFPAGTDLVCATWTSCGTSGQMGTTYGTSTRYSTSTNDTQDGSFNFKWDPTDRLKLNFDVQYVHAIQTNYDITADMATYADITFSGLAGLHPSFTVADASSVNQLPGNITNPGNYHLNDLMDHVTDSTGHEKSARFDAQYSFNSPWLDSLRAGVRIADRDQTVRWTTYNWANVVNNWSNYTADQYFITGAGWPSGFYGNKSLPSNFFGGGTTNQYNAVYFNINLLKNRSLLAQTFGKQSFSDAGSNAWDPICYRDNEVGGNTDAFYNGTSATLTPNSGAGCFEPAEIALVDEKTSAAYMELKFGGRDAVLFGKSVSGNIGLRYVDTLDESTGGTNFSSSMTYATTPTSTQTTPAGTVTVVNSTYYISAADRQFLTLDENVSTVKYNHVNFLPSFNLKVNLTDTWLIRFAASESLSRPDIGNLKSYVSIGAQVPTNPSCTNGGFTCNGSTIVQTNLIYQGTAQNPSLKPITADNLDLTAEDYFSSVGSFTFDLFYKKFYNYIQFGNSIQNITHDGITRSVQISGPVNAPGASIKGFELGYTRYFDFLPAPFNGLGFQGNYTHLVNTGVVTSGLTVNSGDGSAGTGGGGIQTAASHFNKLPLEGTSNDTYNLIFMYEKGNWSGRVAYNWRSEYLVTAADCCIALPVWQKASGFLDASVHYKITDHVELGLEGTNLLDTKTVLMQQVSGPTDANPAGQKLLLPYSIFQNDRRFEATVRVKY